MHNSSPCYMEKLWIEANLLILPKRIPAEEEHKIILWNITSIGSKLSPLLFKIPWTWRVLSIIKTRIVCSKQYIWSFTANLKKTMFVSTQCYIDAWAKKANSTARLIFLLSQAWLETFLVAFLNFGIMKKLKGCNCQSS